MCPVGMDGDKTIYITTSPTSMDSGGASTTSPLVLDDAAASKRKHKKRKASKGRLKNCGVDQKILFSALHPDLNGLS